MFFNFYSLKICKKNDKPLEQLRKKKDLAKRTYDRLPREYMPAALVIWTVKERGTAEPRCSKAIQQSPTTLKQLIVNNKERKTKLNS